LSASALWERPFFERSRRTLLAKRSSRLLTISMRRGAARRDGLALAPSFGYPRPLGPSQMG
jgi:hypothetical protein